MSASDGEGGGPFAARTVALLIGVGVVGFVLMLVMGAFAPALRSGRGGANALSTAATGYAGLVQLAEATGRHPRIVRDEAGFDTDDLLVIAPGDGAVDVSRALARATRPTLVVLPKWFTAADPDHGGWVRAVTPMPAFMPEGVLNPATKLHVALRRSGGRPLVTVAREMGPAVAFDAPRPLQVITGSTPIVGKRPGGAVVTGRLRPLITDGAGGIVLAQVDGGPEYVLSDPDLIDNRGLARLGNARAALAMLDWLNVRDPGGIAFDVTLNGLGAGRSPLRLAFEPPFLAMTLALGVALLLTGLHAAARFGAPRPATRALAFGKRALVDNAAALVARAGRQARLGGRYAAVLRERARMRFGVPARWGGAALDAALDRAGGGRFTPLVAALERARDKQSLVAAARALHDWQGRRG